ncbi:hypothetical protein AIOL_001322 [Candidatus Rhodobacter oscarellae]|uniref:Uncharacterized protein n=1 Tax=Candidatus Rhodobacter oscarellae TaxID=1675527 RepID=A0A0J9E0W8_9RHOB|nr:hypothetical protein [Candidatus Rhodobacter lobularis]KMW56370.1 hypothetical protein AIOL_001322 [Candidatus Rhodobacter lobularis]
MSGIEIAPLNLLPSSTNYDNFSKLTDKVLTSVQQLDQESRGLIDKSGNIANGVEGPARNSALTNADIIASLNRTLNVSVEMNENLVRFSALSSTLTSFGNTLNSFLKGQ